MPTTRAGSPSRTRTAPRFSRTGTPATTSGGWRHRRQPQKSGAQRAIAGITGALPGMGGSKGRKAKATKSRSRGGGKAGGIALVTAAAGMAFKNRNKLMDMLNRKGSQDNAHAEMNPSEAGTRPATGSVDPIRSGNLAPPVPGNRPDL